MTRQRLVERPLAAQRGHQPIVPQLVVIVQILVAQRQGEEALRQQLAHTMLDPVLPNPASYPGANELAASVNVAIFPFA